MSGQAVVTIGSKQWDCTVASTLTELAQGLSGVESMAANAGMLFDLGSVQSSVPINMAEMLFALDIIFIDADGLVSEVFSDVLPLQTGVEGTNARYFMEVNAGEAEGVEVGDTVNIQGVSQPVPGIDVTQIIQAIMIMAILGIGMATMDKWW